MTTGRIRIGTSGWVYSHWRGAFYPVGTRQRDILPVYADRFDTVEINSTFYRLPAANSVATWRSQTPHNFVFACKAHRYLTHRKKLKDPAEPLRLLFERIDHFGDKLGPVLFQLPPRWHINRDRLEEFLDALPGGHRYACEFRDPSWHDGSVLDLLANKGAAFCIYDLAGEQSPMPVTAGFVYIRLHGPGGPYQGSYDGRILSTWARRILGWSKEGKDVYCYFDNDEKGYAPGDASRLRQMVERRGRRDR